MVSSEGNNNDDNTGDIMTVWQSEGSQNGLFKPDTQAHTGHSIPSLGIGSSDDSIPCRPEANLLGASSDLGSTALPKTILTESQIYNAVFHVQQTCEPQGQQITPLREVAPSQEPRTSPSPSTSASIADGEMVASLKDLLPYVPPHSDYAIVKDSYTTTFHKRRSERRKRRDMKRVNTKTHVTVGRPKASKKRTMLSPGSKVLAVAQWIFPTDEQGREKFSKAAFVQLRIRNGLDVDFIPTKNKRETWTRSKRKSQNNFATFVDEHGDPIKNSLVQDVLFDARYFQYDNSPYGFLDQLIRPSIVLVGDTFEPSDAFGESYLQSIPDPPIFLTKTSRVGAAYQARVCRHLEDYHDKRNASYMPE